MFHTRMRVLATLHVHIPAGGIKIHPAALKGFAIGTCPLMWGLNCDFL